MLFIKDLGLIEKKRWAWEHSEFYRSWVYLIYISWELLEKLMVTVQVQKLNDNVLNRFSHPDINIYFKIACCSW